MKDSKTFVDMPMKQPLTSVMDHFMRMMNETGDNPGKARVMKFVNDNFDEAGMEFETWTPADWTKNPAIIDKIADKNCKEFARDLNSR